MDYLPWLSPGNLLSIFPRLPHFTLPILILGAYCSPPFHGRGVLFASLIMVNDYACTVSPWPPNAGATRPTRYGMAGSWLFVLPAVERLLFHVPERDFWLVDRQGEANNGRPRKGTWDKARWVMKLVTSPRAVGWNFGHRKVNDARSAIKTQKLDRQKFVLAKIPRAIMSYLVLDAVICAARSITIPLAWSWGMYNLGKIIYVELLMGLSVYATMTLQYEVAATIAVGGARGQPEVSLACVHFLILR